MGKKADISGDAGVDVIGSLRFYGLWQQQQQLERGLISEIGPPGVGVGRVQASESHIDAELPTQRSIY